MKVLYYFVYYALSFTFIGATLYKSNETDFSTCRVYYSRSGSVYKDFFHIPELINHKNMRDNETSIYILDFHFSVLAASDAHILLAPSESVKKTDSCYEIVIGAGGNTFCDIRRKQKSDVKASVRKSKLLSATDTQSFWLHITKDGIIELGREGEEIGFMSWIDPDPLPLKVFSFSTWDGIEAKWYFDCDRSGSIEEIEKSLTELEKLRRDLLSQYDPYVRPVMNESTITTVYMALETHFIHLDVHKSKLELNGITKLAWHDEKLRWDPDEYGGIEDLHIFRREIWQPDLVLYNAVGNNRDLLQDTLMVVHPSGNVEWNPSIHIESWCDLSDLSRWPSDSHTCHVILAFVKDGHRIKLDFNRNDSSLLDNQVTEWHIEEVNIFADIEHEGQTLPIFYITLNINRHSNMYGVVFFTPFLVISAALLSTFWMDAFSSTKIVLACFTMVLSMVMLIALSVYTPTGSGSIPFLIELYSYTTVAILIAILICTFVINLSRDQKKVAPPHCLTVLLTSAMFRNMLYLPKHNMPNKYGEIDNCVSKDEENNQMIWLLFGVTIDRISFLVYVSLIGYAIGYHLFNN